MRKADIETGVIYRWQHRDGTGLAVVLSTAEQYGAGDRQGYPVVLAVADGGGIDPRRLDGITLAQFEMLRDEPDPPGADAPAAPQEPAQSQPEAPERVLTEARTDTDLRAVLVGWLPRRQAIRKSVLPKTDGHVPSRVSDHLAEIAAGSL